MRQNFEKIVGKPKKFEDGYKRRKKTQPRGKNQQEKWEGLR